MILGGKVSGFQDIYVLLAVAHPADPRQGFCDTEKERCLVSSWVAVRLLFKEGYVMSMISLKKQLGCSVETVLRSTPVPVGSLFLLDRSNVQSSYPHSPSEKMT